MIAFFTFINVTFRNKNQAHIRVALLYFRPAAAFRDVTKCNDASLTHLVDE